MSEECPYKGNTSSSAETLKNAPQNSKTNLPSASILQANTSQTAESLPTDRERSSIPRHDAAGSNWLYPSPRMFYNALLRKGHETRPEDIQVMVDVHNYLNEQVWQEILKWESHHKR
jgi:cytochrome c heme-lyase